MAESTSLAVHLVGSVPLDNTEAVLRAVAGAVGKQLLSIPDGETGERISWIRHLEGKLSSHPELEVDPDFEPFEFRQWDGQLIRAIPWLRFKAGSDPDSIHFETGYAAAAIESFAVFEQLQREGVIDRAVRFQISLPTSMAVAYQYVSPPTRARFISVYERSLLAELDAIFAALPADRLAIQWDVCQEVLVFEDVYPDRGPDYKAQIFAALGRLGNAVPSQAQLGFHLCYGSPRDEHIVQPKDTAVLVEIANGMCAAMTRQVDFIHMPVPKSRSDDAYFAPLNNLVRPPATALYLGLVHHNDAAGDQARLRAARRHVDVDGVSAECGWGRTDPQLVPGLLQAHRALTQ